MHSAYTGALHRLLLPHLLPDYVTVALSGNALITAKTTEATVFSALTTFMNSSTYSKKHYLDQFNLE